MRLYQSCTEMYSEVKRDLHEMGIVVHPQTMQDRDVADDPAYRTLELSPYAFTLLDGSDMTDWLRALGANLQWCEAEFTERVGGVMKNPGEAWRLRDETWRPFLHDGNFAYTYSERMNLKLYGSSSIVDANVMTTPVQLLIDELKKHPDSRQCVLPIFESWTDLPNLGGVARVPCSIYYQFLRRPDGLRCIYSMRSSDFKTHFPYDIWLALRLQRHVATELGLEPGRFTFFTGSLHLYAKDADPGVF